MTVDKKYAQLPLVPESVLKRRHDLDDLARKRAASLRDGVGSAAKKRMIRTAAGGGGGKAKRAFYVKKPETIVARARSRRNNGIRYRRVRRKGMQKRASDSKEFAEREIEDEDEEDADTDRKDDDHQKASKSDATKVKYQKNSVGSKLVFAVRIRDQVGAPRVVTKTLSDLGLNHVHDGVFVRYIPENRRRLHLVEPWVVYGPPTRAVVADLIERRGFARSSLGADGGRGGGEGDRVPLSDNIVIEEALGESCGLLCKEDLVHEIFEVGDAFAEATRFLWPFRLADAKTHFERRTLKLKDGGRDEYGDRGDLINEYVQAVL